MTGVTSVSLISSVTSVTTLYNPQILFPTFKSTRVTNVTTPLIKSASVTSDAIFASQVFSVHSAPRITLGERVDRKHLAYEDGVIQALRPSFSCATSVTTFIFYLLSTSIPVLQELQV